MKEEIKEILKILKECEFGACITKHNSRVLLDYLTNLQEELKLKTDYIKELLTIISVVNDYELQDNCYMISKAYQDKLKKLKSGDNNDTTCK